jgi:hypothetical protein
MTKVTILGEEPQKKELKKIEFVKGITARINDDARVFTSLLHPNDYESITVVKAGGEDFYDLFICESGKAPSGYKHYYLGHFNDGVV